MLMATSLIFTGEMGRCDLEAQKESATGQTLSFIVMDELLLFVATMQFLHGPLDRVSPLARTNETAVSLLL